MAYVLDNNVNTTLNTAIGTADTNIIINVAAAPFRSPPAPAGGNLGVVTIMDSAVAPSKIEVVTYTTATNNGDGTITLSGCARGQEGFVASIFNIGAIIIGAMTAGVFNSVSPNANSTLLSLIGDGSDGDAVISTSVTLSSDMYYRNLTIVSPGVVNTNGYAIFVQGTLDLSGATTDGSGIRGAAGSPAVANVGGAGAVGHTLSGGSDGGAGGAVTLAGGAAPLPVAGNGGSGGDGGLGNLGGSPTARGAAATYANGVVRLDPGRPVVPILYAGIPIAAGLGGGGGGGGSATAGGGGGGGGGPVVVFAGTILGGSTPANVPIIGGRGGAGGPATGAGGGTSGGGGGGGGGPVLVGYGSRLGAVVPCATWGGAGGGAVAANGGSAGTIRVWNLKTGILTEHISAGGTGGGTSAGVFQIANVL